MTLIGYGRVSTPDQNPDAQREFLEAAGCERIFFDLGVSGKLARRPELDKALDYLRPGDTLVITKLDRLGRSVKHLVDLVLDLGERRIDLKVLHQGIDTSSPAGKLIFHVLASIAEFERDLIRERTMEGLQSARARGRKGGRPSKMTPEKIEVAREMYDSKKYTVEQIAKTVGVGRTTLYRHLESDAASA